MIEFLVIGLCTLISGYLQITFWTMAGERQTYRIRLKALQSLICQKDISFFDTNSPGQLTTFMSE